MQEREHDRSGEALEPPAGGERRPSEEAEADRVLRWRFSRLLAAGYPVEEALQIALHPEVDLHRASPASRSARKTRSARSSSSATRGRAK